MVSRLFLSIRASAMSVLFLLTTSACAGLGAAQAPLDAAAIPTLAVQTLQALQTSAVLSATPTVTAHPATATLQPTATLAPSSTPRPTKTAFPTFTPGPSITPRPPASAGNGGSLASGAGTSGSGSSGTGWDSGSTGQAAPALCNAASLVEDITFPDGTRVSPGSQFTKIWRVKNAGSCAWNDKYSFVFDGGQAMEGERIEIPETVKPGEMVDLAIDMVAPVEAGAYRGRWMLSAGEDDTFGLGSKADKPLLVEIVVDPEGAHIHYNFAANYCAAEWESQSGELECPGEEGDKDGFILRLGEPALETRHEDQPAVWMSPDLDDNGWIRGTYPPLDVQPGDRFIADVGCLEGAEKCDVIFQLRYRIAGEEEEKKLGEWEEQYDESITRVDVGLNDLAGKEVRFILMVRAGESSREDEAFWLVPQIRRK